MRDEDTVREAPPMVVGAVAAGTAPLPFLAVYAVVFIIHGTFHPAHPPDITSTKDGELVAGLIAAAIFVVLAVTVLWFLNARRRWPFVVGQLVVLGAAITFLLDDTAGGMYVSILMVATSLIALLLALTPQSWRYFGASMPPAVGRAFRPRAGASSR